MGYKVHRNIYKLRFEGAEYEGLEVRAKSVALGQFMDMMKLADLKSKKSLTEEDRAAIDSLFERFAKVLVSWNLEDDDDKPVPTTKEGLYSLDFEFALLIILAWMDAVAGVSGPLGKPSSNGSPSLEESIPMETLWGSPIS